MRSVTWAAVVVLSLGALSACAGGTSPAAGSASPADAMSQAEQHLDTTSGVMLSLSTDGDPGGDAYLTSAQGTITDAPAFQGTASGKYQGLPASGIGVISVGGTFYLDVPIKGWTKLEPASLCAPDPALLLDADTGVGSLLAAATDLAAGSATRGGTDNNEILTPYTGTVPGTAMVNILPCSKGSSYAATFTVSSTGYLRTASVTGDFAGDGTSLTYTIDVSAYDVSQTVTAPKLAGS